MAMTFSLESFVAKPIIKEAGKPVTIAINGKVKVTPSATDQYGSILIALEQGAKPNNKRLDCAVANFGPVGAWRTYSFTSKGYGGTGMEDLVGPNLPSAGISDLYVRVYGTNIKNPEIGLPSCEIV